jgi:exosortase
MSRSTIYSNFVGLCLLSLFLWWRALFATLALALQNDAYTHILLILPTSIALISLEWRSRKVKPEPNFPTGCALMLIAVTIDFVGSRWWGLSSLAGDERLSLSMLALVAWWIGSFVCCFGIRLSRAYIFPLCFLLWLVPLPEFALNHIVSFLQQGSAYAARLLFAIALVPVAQDGVRLSIPGLTLEVAKECSSIRSSLMLLVTTMVLAHLLLRSAWGKGLVILAAIPLSLAKNGLRVFTLAILGVYVDPAFLDGWLHHHGGVVFFLVFLASLFALLRLVRWAECNPMAQLKITHLATPIAASKANT